MVAIIIKIVIQYSKVEGNQGKNGIGRKMQVLERWRLHSPVRIFDGNYSEINIPLKECLPIGLADNQQDFPVSMVTLRQDPFDFARHSTHGNIISLNRLDRTLTYSDCC